MKNFTLLIFAVILIYSTGCNKILSITINAKTSYLDRELRVDRQVLNLSKTDSYEVTTVIECPVGQKVLYKIQNTLIYEDQDGGLIAEGGKSKGHMSGFKTVEEIKSGTIKAYKIDFKTPISNGKFVVKVGDSVVMSRVLTGDNVKIDYGFKLP